MKFKISIITTLAVFLLSCCQGKVDNEEGDVLFPEITKNVDKGKLSEIISVSDARILGDYKDFMIGRIKKINQFDDKKFAIQSTDTPIVIFDSTARKFTEIGSIGGGEGEYTDPLDFDIEGNIIYILTVKGIMRYGLDGKYIDTIKTDLNADGIHVVDDKIMLFVLGDEHVIHMIDMGGKTLSEELPRNAALRLSRANSFYEYGNYILFHEGHSNNIFAYDRDSKSFRELNIIPAEEALSIGEETNLIENGAKTTEQGKAFFDGLTAAGQQLFVGVMKDNKPFFYLSDNKNKTSISITDIDDDILYNGTISFFSKGVVSNDKFITYVYPYVLIENKDKILESSSSPEVIKDIVGKVKEDDNPIVIEYEFK